ncbi:MAG TPA: hypothetical protein VGR81_06000 [Candidatus Acidoferrales bacterium]|nr:hypothetical protein [Candidatus Acidoferrales bacterium]
MSDRKVHRPRMFQRIQSGLLIVALLAVPFALLVRGYCCGPQQCAMLCCLHRGQAMGLTRGHSSSGALHCGVRCNYRNSLDYGLAAPLPPTQLSAAIKLPSLESARSAVARISPVLLPGFSRIPLEPPRLLS